MSYRLQVTIADDIANQLERRAQTAGQPASRVAATLINLALADHAGKRNATTPSSPRQMRPPWLEPHDPDERRIWRGELWLAVLALCARYPRELQRLESGWWRTTSRIEQLAALDAWRFRIDQTGQDPREELAFQAQLAEVKSFVVV
ncbi:MAG TPA: hypothetical protein VME22_00075 [Solirubrobacteraceae bacterium]|nr:hypothetical protein [Solirubrobacteraceae bacterium]